MSLQTLLAVLIFSTVMAFTPGPNNAMLASSGSRFGLARTLPHVAGVTLGFPVMIFLVGVGLASILLASPMLQLAMKSISCAYLLWMAFQIARSSGGKNSRGKDRPLTCLQAAAFQWINPKAWMMAVGAISAYTTANGRLYLEVAIIAGISLAVSIFSTSIPAHPPRSTGNPNFRSATWIIQPKPIPPSLQNRRDVPPQVRNCNTARPNANRSGLSGNRSGPI